MKKLILVIALLVLSTLSFGQVLTFKSTAFACNVYSNGYWSGWSDWEDSNLYITMNLNTDVVTIYSPVKQIYHIYKSEGEYYDEDGDYNADFSFIDNDLDKGTMKLLQRKTGVSEIYIYFANVTWCYTVVREN